MQHSFHSFDSNECKYANFELLDSSDLNLVAPDCIILIRNESTYNNTTQTSAYSLKKIRKYETVCYRLFSKTDWRKFT